MMLSRVAERVYWMARYLERVENTARLVNAHTILLMDMPDDVQVNWFTLIKTMGQEEKYFQTYRTITENNVMSFLLVDDVNHDSLIRSVSSVRENARTSLDLLPEELWLQTNELYLYLKDAHLSIGNRYRRQKILLDVLAHCQRIYGILDNYMSRNNAFSFFQLGKYVERTDMISRILETTSVILSDTDSLVVRNYSSILWASVLRALSAQQMYIQNKRQSKREANGLKFLISDERFPRSLNFSIASIGNYLQYLPNADEVIEKQNVLLQHVQSPELASMKAEEAHILMNQIQIELSALHQQINDSWFHPETTAV